MITLFCLLAVLILVGLWFVFSLKIVGPDEMAIKVLFGRPKTFCDSGFRFVPFLPRFKCYLKRYTKKMYNFDYKAREVITKSDKYPLTLEGVQYSALSIRVDAVAYLNFPREQEMLVAEETDEPVCFLKDLTKEQRLSFKKDKVVEIEKNKVKVRAVLEKHHPLIKILKAGVPIEDEKLKDWTEEAVVGALRLAFGQMTWRQSIEDMDTINRKVVEVFLDIDGALIRAGFRPPGIKLVVAEIHLPKSVEDALTLPEKTRLEADAAEKAAEAQAIDLVETILYTMARSRGVELKCIKEEIKGNPELQRELLQYAKELHAQLEKAEKGAFFEFNAPGKSGIEKSILNTIALLLRGVPGGKGSAGQGSSEGQPQQKGERELIRKELLDEEEAEFAEDLKVYNEKKEEEARKKKKK